MTTSGSTGFPLEFYADRAAEDVWLGTYLFFLGWFGAGIWDARITVTSSRYQSGGPRPSALARLVRRAVLGEQAFHLAGLEATATDLRGCVRRLGHRSYYLRGYPSYIAQLGVQMLEEGPELTTPPQVVVTHAETLTTPQLATIERAYHCRVANQYSTWEVPQIAQTCPDNSAILHVNNQRAIVRVVRSDGGAAAPGQPGRVLLTDLGNQVMPFINYDVGDWAVAGGTCPCGRGFPTLERVEGRVGETLRLSDGRLITVGALSNFLTVANPVLSYVWEFQLVRRAGSEVVLRIVPTGSFTLAFADDLCRKLQAYLGPGLHASVEAVDRIDPEPSGKRLVIKSEPYAAESELHG